MTYQESAEPLTFKQKAKRAAIVTSYLFVFVVGGITIPLVQEGWNLLIAPLYESKPYVAPKSDYDLAIEEALKNPKNIETCRAIAEMDVVNEMARKASTRFDELSPILNRKTTMINGGISEKTAVATNSIEKAQGR